MRRPTIFFLVVIVCLIVFAIRSVFTLLTLLVEDASADAIHSAEIPAPNSPLIEDRPQLIPKIIHQTYVNDSVPEHWREAQRSCIDLHADYEYKLWTDAKSRALIATEYPWFLSTFDAYPHPIQRADAIRYFVLAHYGGIYIDLDDGCNRRLDPLLSYPSWLRRTKPTGISNDAMGSTPRHPFFLLVIESLIPYNKDWALPYITVMGSTGPLFLSVIWQQYKRGRAHSSSAAAIAAVAAVADAPTTSTVGPWDGREEGRVRVLMPDEYNRMPWSFFKWHGGSSWHGRDARLIFWMGRHWVLLTAGGVLVAGVLGLSAWWLYIRVWSLGESGRKRRGGGGGVVSVGGGGGGSFAVKGGWLERVAVWRRRAEGLGLGGGKGYALVERHEV